MTSLTIFFSFYCKLLLRDKARIDTTDDAEFVLKVAAPRGFVSVNANHDMFYENETMEQLDAVVC